VSGSWPEVIRDDEVARSDESALPRRC